MVKIKWLFLVFSCFLMASAIVAGPTFALFTDSSQLNFNMFQSGTLKLVVAKRDDVPMQGPMFYTETNEAGWSGTGFWTPGDTHTRAIFIENVGKLDAKLSALYAIPEAAAGTTAYQDALTFAQNALVTVAYYEMDKPADETSYRTAMEKVDRWYRKQFDESWNAAIETLNKIGEDISRSDLKGQEDEVIARALAEANQAFLQQVFVAKDLNNNDVSFRVKQLTSATMQHLFNGVTPATSLTVAKNQTALLGYTVILPLSAGNEIQGKTVKFSFRNTFQSQSTEKST